MNTEEKAILADDLSVYITDKHTQEECVGFIDGYKAALTKLKTLGTHNVSQQRELLTMEKEAKKYINSVYVDYGDLNEKAEEQIEKAFIEGMKKQLILSSVTVPKDTAIKFYICLDYSRGNKRCNVQCLHCKNI
jgi:hypothetical protein